MILEDKKLIHTYTNKYIIIYKNIIQIADCIEIRHIGHDDEEGSVFSLAG